MNMRHGNGNFAGPDRELHVLKNSCCILPLMAYIAPELNCVWRHLDDVLRIPASAIQVAQDGMKADGARGQNCPA